MKEVVCWFDYSSPFAYLGTTQVESVARRHGATVRFQPFLLGALFKLLGTPLIPLDSFSAPKRRHQLMDLHRWADHHGVPYRFNSTFPLRTVNALRLTLSVPDETRSALVHRLMRAAWVEDEDLADHSVLARAIEALGLEPSLLDVLDSSDARRALREATDQAVSLGLPGAPCFEVDGRIYWGQDRLDFVARALDGRPPREGPGE